MASNAENVFIWWRHHAKTRPECGLMPLEIFAKLICCWDNIWFSNYLCCYCFWGGYMITKMAMIPINLGLIDQTETWKWHNRILKKSIYVKVDESYWTQGIDVTYKHFCRNITPKRPSCNSIVMTKRKQWPEPVLTLTSHCASYVEDILPKGLICHA